MRESDNDFVLQLRMPQQLRKIYRAPHEINQFTQDNLIEYQLTSGSNWHASFGVSTTPGLINHL